MSHTVGVVIIGRNEGARLIDCIKSIQNDKHHVVYVDSASTDDSVINAKHLGSSVVCLDMSIPFSAARARNEGFSTLLQHHPDISYVQFVDGDCQVDKDWLFKASQTLTTDDELAIVCGRRRERFPEHSIYNYMCDEEWNTPVGEAKACGGDFLIKKEAFLAAKGFNPSLIAGEEPELCVRLRKQGYKIQRLNEEMTLHDANITHLSQWWKRSVRAGHAYAEGAWMHGRKPEQHKVKEVVRSWFWAALLPALILGLGFTTTWGFCLILLYPLQFIRMALRSKSNLHHPWALSFFNILGKFPELQGQLQFWINRFKKKQSTLIEYK